MKEVLVKPKYHPGQIVEIKHSGNDCISYGKIIKVQAIVNWGVNNKITSIECWYYINSNCNPRLEHEIVRVLAEQ